MSSLVKHDRYDYIPLPERQDYSWPGGKRLAVCICNNIEIFSFRDGLGSDSAQPGSPQTARNFAWRDYGNRVGQWYLFDMLDELDLPASHNFNALLIEGCPQIAERIKERGDEFIGHGLTNAERQDTFSAEEERKMIEETAAAIERYSGERPRGWLGPWLAETDVTLDLLKEAGFDYVLDWPADDQPFWMRTRAGPLMSVPYSIELNDSPAMVFRHHTGIDFERMITDQFDEMLHQSKKRPLVFTVVLHSFVIGQPYRLRAFRRALEHILEHRKDIWITKIGEVATYAANQPIPSSRK
jgi:allantoinase